MRLEMKRKYYFIILFLILAIFLSGCAGGGIVTPATDEAKIKTVINDFCSAVNDQNWSKAESYCIYGSDEYLGVSQVESLVNNMYSYCNIITINYIPNVLNVSISGNYAQAYTYLSFIASCDGTFESNNNYVTFRLQKIGNTWKLY